MWRRLLDRGRTDGAGAVPQRLASESEADHLARLARALLPPDVADQWLALLRPAARLVAAQDDDPVVARLGGSPRLPAGTPWPVWEGHGPLSFVGEVDLPQLARSGVVLDVPLPDRGRLLLFYFDGSYDDFAGVVGSWDPDSLAGARVLHLAEDRADCAVQEAPERVPVFAERELRAVQVTTFPTWEHPALRRAFSASGSDHETWMRHPVNAERFVEALDAVHAGVPLHQVGGWADAVQGPVELEVAHAALRLDDWEDPRLQPEAERWRLLLQVDSDGDMEWGDAGTLYWLARDDDLAAGDLGRTSFTWQCG